MQAPIPAAEVRAELAAVLARTELRERESLLERLIDWLAPQLSTSQVHALGDVLQGIFVAVAVVVVFLVVRRSWLVLRAPRAEEARVAVASGHATRDRLRVLIEAARAARAAGDLRLALRLFLHGLLIALGGRGDLQLNSAWTNRELLRRGQPSREARALLAPLVRELEPKEFGRAPVHPSDVDRLEALLLSHSTGPEGRA